MNSLSLVVKTLFLVAIVLHSKLSLALPGDKPHVIVIGAGLAGLNSALLLQELDFQVTVLEARSRVGGRIFTLDEIPGKPEAGGNVIGPSYARVLARSRELGLQLVPARQIAGGRENMNLYVSGEFIPLRDWAGSPVNPLPEGLRAVPPGGLLFSLLRPNPLAQPESWVAPDYTRFDRPVSELLPAFGFEQQAAALAGSNNSYGDSLETTSLLQLYHIAAVYSAAQSIPGKLMEIAGGNQRLPEAMAEALEAPVLTGKIVTSIERDDTGVEVTCRDGSKYRADYVVSAVPATALREIVVRPDLPAPQRTAIASLNYAQTFQAHFTVDRPYWGDQTPSLWTDTAVGRLFATAMGDDDEVTNLTLWITGKNARHFAGIPPRDRDQALLDALYAVYPSARGAVHLRQIVDWGSEPFSGGSWAAWLPGQITQYLKLLSRPHDRLYFAGEHTAITNTGMEGAMESSERVVTELLASRKQLAGKGLFVYCQACHSSAAGEPHKLGPNLAGFFDRPVASRPGYTYSESLAQATFAWDRTTLRAWLLDPQSIVPGNRMLYTNALDKAALERLLDYLAGLDGPP